jgi:hypothetical protein
MWDNDVKGLDGVGWIQVWINSQKNITLGSDHTKDREIAPDSGSKKILAVQVSYLLTSTKCGTPDQRSLHRTVTLFVAYPFFLWNPFTKNSSTNATF